MQTIVEEWEQGEARLAAEIALSLYLAFENLPTGKRELIRRWDSMTLQGFDRCAKLKQSRGRKKDFSAIVKAAKLRAEGLSQRQTAFRLYPNHEKDAAESLGNNLFARHGQQIDELVNLIRATTDNAMEPKSTPSLK